MKVFISYARKNPAYLDKCEEILKPFAQDQRIELWIDKRDIEPGDDWRKEIHHGLESSDVAVLLITSAFMASDFIKKVELPALLSKLHDRDTATLLPIFLEPANVNLHPIPFTNRYGNKSSITLDKIQGIGDPEKPLDHMGPPEARTAWAQLGKEIKKRLNTTPPPSTSSPIQPARTIRPLPTLDIHLRIEGDKLHRSINTPSQQENLPPVSWADWQQQLLVIQNWQQELDQAVLKDQGSSWGEKLFQLLFDDGQEQEVLFSKLNGNRQIAKKPTYQPYQVRIHTSDGELLNLPWQLCDWRGQLRLHGSGWRFMTADNEAATPINIRLPFRTLVLISDRGGLTDKRVSRIVNVLQGLFAIPQNDPDRLLTIKVMDQDDWRQHTQDRELTLMLYLDTGQATAERLALFGQALASGRQHLPFLAAVGTGPLPNALKTLSPHADLISVEHAANPDNLLSAQWLHHCLTDQLDPVKAWNDILHPVLHDQTSAASLQIHAQQTDWTLGHTRTVLSDQLWRIFDRLSLKKALAGELIRATQPRDTQRVLAVCPFGLPGDQVSRFSDQLGGYIQDKAWPNIPLISLGPVGLPTEVKKNLGARLNDHLLTHLPECDIEQDIKAYLNSCITPAARERARREDRKPIIWLYWGAFGDSPGLGPKLSAKQLMAWLHYCSGKLAIQSPPDALVISVLAVESSSSESMSKLGQLLHNALQDPALFAAHFSLLDPKPLERIDVTHIYELFRENPGLFQGSDELRRDVASVIVTKSAGEFQQAVSLLNRGHTKGWEQLLCEIGDRPMASDTDNFDL